MELSIPEIYALEMVCSYHFFNGHPCVEKLIKGLKLRYQFQNGYSIMDMRTGSKGVVSFVRPANTQIGQWKADMIWPLSLRHPLTSVCVDIFTLSEIVWQNNSYDALVLCVDRHSGWMNAQPSQHKSLTAEKCAHLLIDGGCSQFGVPSTIASDRGPQFVGKWFVTMCAR